MMALTCTMSLGDTSVCKWGGHGLDVHMAFGDLTAFEADIGQPVENRQRHSGNVDIVDVAIAIA